MKHDSRTHCRPFYDYCDTSPRLEPVTGIEIKLLRHKLGWSANRMGQELGITRSYIKHLESQTEDAWEVRPRMARRFRALEKRVHLGLKWKSEQRTVIYSRFKIPSQLTILLRPRKCRGHRRYTLFKTANQKYCNAQCECLWIERQKRWRKYKR